MPFYTEQQIEQIRTMDLLTYLQTYEPTELVHVRGNTYCTREHDSLKISNGKWMWWSRGFGGSSALDYLIKVKGMQFLDAMKILSNEKGNIHHSSTERSEKPDSDVRRRLLLPERNENEMAVIWYLVGRGIDYDIIKECIDNGLIYESEVYHNCVFLGLDENGKAAYATIRSSSDDCKFKGEAVGSDKRYSFRIEANSNTIHVFESAIDLLSYATIMKMRTGNWRAETMVSLGGVYAPSPNKLISKIPAALDNALQNHPEVKAIALHLDNDNAGRAAALSITEQLKDRYEMRNEPPPKGKDCNDYLMHVHNKRLYKTKGEKEYDGDRI